MANLFTVSIRKVNTRTAQVEVCADDWEQAQELAQDIVAKKDFSGWDPEYDPDEIEVTDVVEEAP